MGRMYFCDECGYMEPIPHNIEYNRVHDDVFGPGVHPRLDEYKCTFGSCLLCPRFVELVEVSILNFELTREKGIDYKISGKEKI
jgi:hypothetical protein